jgi:hypothetical protein
MKESLKLTLAIVLTAIVTFIATTPLARKDAINTFRAAVFEMEAFNEVGRVEAWDRVEQLLAQGCNNEALELVKIEQSKALSTLKYHIGTDAKLLKKITERNRLITKRAYAIPKSIPHRIPICK